MLKTYNMLLEEYHDYSDADNKISRLVKSKKLFKLTKGLYETERDTPGYALAGAIYGPSYLSFDYALSFYGLIPETVFTYTSATFEKGRSKRYINDFGCFTYRDVPSNAFPYEIRLLKENDYIVRIASPEKAICDKLYSLSPVSNKTELSKLLFDDLRIDEAEFEKLDKQILRDLCDCYKSTNLKMLKKVLR